jgi:hypothetical protein
VTELAARADVLTAATARSTATIHAVEEEAEITVVRQENSKKTKRFSRQRKGRNARAARGGGAPRPAPSHGSNWACAMPTTGTTVRTTRRTAALRLPERLNAVAAGMLVHVECQLTARRYLVDTRATFSLVPHKSSKTPARQPRLISPNELPIKCWGEERRRLHIDGRQFEWEFLLGDVTFPMLGVDFLRAYRLAGSGTQFIISKFIM